ncbi:hypothetical protein ACFIJ5_18515 (plasmid) [Haloimpatiens sp. FM7330]|uniref:hypothetical protein n=1 Tax=Haloimpatiens sp. FM7330 TaxID=3298610 RepID=UPI00363EB67F
MEIIEGVMMKNSRKIISIILIFLAVGTIIYIILPKSGSFNDLILSQYKENSFDEALILTPRVDGKRRQIICKDKNKINKFLSYLEKIKIMEYRKKLPYNYGDMYILDVYFRYDDSLSIKIYDKDLNFIEVSDKYTTKWYKIVNDKFDMKFIKQFLQN